VSASSETASFEILQGSRNVVTAHPPQAYPGLLVVKPGPLWSVFVIVPEVGQTIVGQGGEKTYAYETVDGGRADALELQAGDRATLVRADLPFCLCEWRVERAASAVEPSAPRVSA
jgi:hypothetical protein